MEKMLEVRDLEKSYSNFKLNKITFYIPRGSITGFIGINGSGKTTTIKLLLKLIEKEQGEIKFWDKDLEKNERMIKDKIGVVLDGDCFYECFNLKQMKNVIAPAYSKWREDTYQELLKKFHLHEKMKISSLSKGMKMKYALTLALAHETKLLIMDEPANGLDPLVRGELNDIMKEYVKDGDKSVLFSTHITSDLDEIADDIIFIDKGNIVLQEKKSKLLSDYVKITGKTSSDLAFLEENGMNYEEYKGEFTCLVPKGTKIPEEGFSKADVTIEDIMRGIIKEERK